MKLIINSCDTNSGNLHLNISGFSIDASGLNGSEVINITVDNSGKCTIDVVPDNNDTDLVSNLESSNNDINETQDTTSQDLLFEKLAILRRKIASEENVPPYYVFHDATLKSMSSTLPVDLDSMKNISGVGKMKLEKYGTAFVNEIKKYIANSA
jgi:superfamily II DNA helicase RecQ